jgi:arginyl-tRNA synthetase
MIAADLRKAICRAAGFRLDPGLRPGAVPGEYSSTAPFNVPGASPLEAARELAGKLAAEPWIESAEVTGTGYLTITITRAALEAVPARIVAKGPDCVRNDALVGTTVSTPLPTDIGAAETWPQAHAALITEITARLRHASGATFTTGGRASVTHRCPSKGVGDSPMPFVVGKGEVVGTGEAVAWAGQDAVRFALATIPQGHNIHIDPETLARHTISNQAFAVRYAHARAASVLRWVAVHEPPAASTQPEPGPLTAPELELVGLLSWLPERVAIAARRERPDEFARYLAELATASIVATGTPSNLELAAAARTGLAAGLGLLGIAAPDRL